MLVDGQQRISTLYQYFAGSNEIRLGRTIKTYHQLSDQQKIEFLEYEVVVRDLGSIDIRTIKDIFERINSTSYSLNAMEIRNSRYAGELKTFGELISQHGFFDDHRIFSANEIRRMSDVGFALTLTITIMSNYFNRDDAIEEYLSRYNDEYDYREEVSREIERVFQFVNSLDMPPTSRMWKRSDLLTVLVEIHRSLIKMGEELDSRITAQRLKDFYYKVDNVDLVGNDDPHLRLFEDYGRAAIQATNDRSSRIRRGEIVRMVLQGQLEPVPPSEGA